MKRNGSDPALLAVLIVYLQGDISRFTQHHGRHAQTGVSKFALPAAAEPYFFLLCSPQQIFERGESPGRNGKLEKCGETL